MAKKNKDDAPNPNSVSNRDILQRLNFLYQASTLLGTMNTPPPEIVKDGSPKVAGKARKEARRKAFKERHSTACIDLSRTYVKSMKAIGQKTNMRMDPAVKRTLCKGCNLVLVPGMTETVRVNPSAGYHIVCYTCMSCKTTKRIPAPPILDETELNEIAPPKQSTSSRPEHPAECDPDAMSVDPLDTLPSSSKPAQPPKPSRRTRGPKPRPPPLFERNIHVVFRGNERIV